MRIFFFFSMFARVCLINFRQKDTDQLSRLMTKSTKSTKWHVRPAKTQISLDTRPVWSESSLSAWRKLGSLATHWAHSEDSDQTGRMLWLIWIFAGRTGHFVGFVMRWLNSWTLRRTTRWLWKGELIDAIEIRLKAHGVKSIKRCTCPLMR